MKDGMVDRLYSTFQAGQLLGGLSAEAVCHLGRDGKLELVTQVVRGKGKLPHKFVRASELNRYIAELSDARPKTPATRRNKRMSSALAKEIAEATSYI